MERSIAFPFLPIIVIILRVITLESEAAAAAVTYADKFCVNNGIYTLDGVYQKNLHLLLANLSSQASIVKFYTSTIGNSPNNTAYGLFQCRKDLSLEVCSECIKEAATEIVLRCPLYYEANIWYFECTLRYANRSFFSLSETYPYSGTYVLAKVSDTYANFSSVFTYIMNRLIYSPAFNSPELGYFATTKSSLTPSTSLYGLAQCTPDSDGFGCNSCLASAVSEIAQFNASAAAMILAPSCQLRYDTTLFYNDTAISLALPPSTPPNRLHNSSTPGDQQLTHKKPRNLPIILAIAGSVGLAVVISGGIWVCVQRNRVKRRAPEMPRMPEMGLHNEGDIGDVASLESIQFDFKTIKAATLNFSKDNKLGEGGFGEVYKGVFLNGEEIAVKRLSKDSQQGTTEFKNEVLLVAKLQHRNLVKLLGFCISGEEKIVIYEFLSNSSLDRFLYDPMQRALLGWELRYKIITGIARGLLYLHEDSRLKIIHRDLKVSNILLDDSMNAKIADFGLAKLFDLDQTQDDTMRIAGTFGYMAPEYAMAGQFSVKSDVYSFGVIILEIVSGQRNNFHRRQAEEGLLHRAWRHWNEKAPLELVDPGLGNLFSEEEVKLCIQIGLQCIQEDPTHRPRMTSVVAALNGDSITLPSPNAPHFFTFGSNSTADVTTSTSSNQDSLASNKVKPENSGHSNSEAYTGTTSITEVCPR